MSPVLLAHVALAALSCKVEEAGAKMVFISNAFSFDKATGKSGNSAPDAKFLQKLLRLDDQLWSLSERLLPHSASCLFEESFEACCDSQSFPVLRNHLRDAGLKESGRFSVDQMAKWLCKMPMPGRRRVTAIGLLHRSPIGQAWTTQQMTSAWGLQISWRDIDLLKDHNRKLHP